MRWAIKESDFRSELSSDLEWMIQSGQVDNEAILTALIQRFYIPVSQIIWSILEDPFATRRAISKVFTLATMQVYRYRNQVSVEGWFYQVVWQIINLVQRQESVWRKIENMIHAPGEFTGYQPLTSENKFAGIFLKSVDRLPLNQRKLIFFVEIGGLSPEVMSEITGRNPQDIEEELDSIWEALYQSHMDTGLTGSLFRSHGQAAIRTRRPSLESTPEMLTEYAKQIDRQMRRENTHHQGVAIFKEIVLLLVTVFLVIAFIWGGQQLISGSTRHGEPGTSIQQETVIFFQWKTGERAPAFMVGSKQDLQTIFVHG